MAGSTSDIDDGWGELLGDTPEATPAPVPAPAPVVPPVPKLDAAAPVAPPPAFDSATNTEPSATAVASPTEATEPVEADAATALAPANGEGVETTSRDVEPPGDVEATGEAPASDQDDDDARPTSDVVASATGTDRASDQDDDDARPTLSDVVATATGEPASTGERDTEAATGTVPTPAADDVATETRDVAPARDEGETAASASAAAATEREDATTTGDRDDAASDDVAAPGDRDSATRDDTTTGDRDEATSDDVAATSDRDLAARDDTTAGDRDEAVNDDVAATHDVRSSGARPALAPAATAPSWNRPILWAGGLAAIVAVGLLSWAGDRESTGRDAAPVADRRGGAGAGGDDAADRTRRVAEAELPTPATPDRAAAPELDAATPTHDLDPNDAPSLGAASKGDDEVPAELEPEGDAPLPEADDPTPETEDDLAPPEADDPTPPAPEPSRSSTPVVSGDPEAAYAEAEKAYAADRSNEALEQMALAACEMLDGPKARSAYRKLRGSEPRSRIMKACKAQKIDLNYRGDGASPDELLRTARRALDRGDPQKAFDDARASNRARRSKDALILMALAACDLKDDKQARYLVGMLNPKDRGPIDARCREQGIDLS